MASIQNVVLQIVENQGAAAALVTYRLVGSPQDVQLQRRYRETVELVGVDEGPGEDGSNELIPGGRFDAVAAFTVPALNRSRLLAVPSAALDEDPGRSGPLAMFRNRDEIRARVTLVQIPPPAVTADSNVVFRDEQLIQPVLDPVVPA
jgi:hypothetical protein